MNDDEMFFEKKKKIREHFVGTSNQGNFFLFIMIKNLGITLHRLTNRQSGWQSNVMTGIITKK